MNLDGARLLAVGPAGALTTPAGTVLVGRARGPRPEGGFADELALVAGSSVARHDELVDGRWCAHRAMERIGVTAEPVLRTEAGAPVWPPGLRGSISHCASYAVAAVTRSPEVRALGVDVELAQPLTDEVLGVVLTSRERTTPAPGPGGEVVRFSAKESVYKAWSSAGGGWLDFADVEVALGADGTFAANVLDRERVEGAWVTIEGLVLTLAVLAATD